MRSLYLRIWLTVVAALALFALVSGWLWQGHFEQERARFEAGANDRLAAWAELVQRALPSADAPAAEQAEALRDWSARLRLPLALDDRRGSRIGASDSFLRRQAEGAPPSTAVRLDDGRTLWIARRMMRRPPTEGPAGESGLGWRDDASGPGSPWSLRALVPRALVPGDKPSGAGYGERRHGMPPGSVLPMVPDLSLGLPKAIGSLILVAMLFVAVAAGAYPVVRRLTRRLELLKRGVEAFGVGDLSQRVESSGRDEVAAVSASFNDAAGRIEHLVRMHQNLLANASHELRSPLARLKMAVALFADGSDDQRAVLKREIDTNVAELDALVEEVLLASRLDAGQAPEPLEPVDLLALAAEEAARVNAEVEALDEVPRLPGSERLLRRALRNLLENARRYGGGDISVAVALTATGRLEVKVCDRGPGVPAELRQRIFEPFFRVPGHTEREGGVGLGLSLVRQIAERHGGQVACEAREGGGSCFVLSLPRAGPAA